MFRAVSAVAFCTAAWAQTTCPPTPQYTPCDLVFDIPAADPAKPPDLEAEYRSPRHDSGIVKAFWDGGTRWIIRITPSEAGTYAWKLKDGREGEFTATPSTKAGWLRAANIHHFALADAGGKLTPHLWMGAVEPGFASMDLARWKALVDERAGQHFNHLGITLVDRSVDIKAPAFFHAAEEKIRYANQHDIIVDVAFFGPDNLMDRLLPTPADRKTWFTYAIARLAGFDITWQGVEAWETYDHARDELKEIAGFLTNLDPYKHPRSSRTNMTTGGLADDGWLDYRSYQTADNAVTAVEQQIYRHPAIDNFSAGGADFRHALWNATMSGQYPSPVIPNPQAASEMKIWYDFLKESRHWETEPFFDVEGGRGLALGGIEYLIYVEKPGPVTVHLEDHGYDALWFNPLNGQRVKIREAKGKVFTGAPPDTTHDWVLRISREGTKAGMLKSYKFDSQEIVMQTVEGIPEKVPFEVVQPEGDTLTPRFEIKLTRTTPVMQQMLYEWTGEVTVDNRSYRVIGTGPAGTFNIPPGIAEHYPAALHVRINAVNGLGKAYVLDRNYTLNK